MGGGRQNYTKLGLKRTMTVYLLSGGMQLKGVNILSQYCYKSDYFHFVLGVHFNGTQVALFQCICYQALFCFHLSHESTNRMAQSVHRNPMCMSPFELIYYGDSSSILILCLFAPVYDASKKWFLFKI